MRIRPALLLCIVALLVAGAASAHAADRVYWGNLGANKISYVNLDTSAAGDLPIAESAINVPAGLSLDPASGRIYWANNGPDTLAFANLDGSEPGTLNSTGVSINNPGGVAVDAAGGRLYFSAYSSQNVGYVNLNGSGGAEINTTGSSASQPNGVALDLAAGRIYFATDYVDSISYANLNGTGGANLNTTGATALNDPVGVAIDAAAGKIYWANSLANKISYAKLDGSGGGDLNTTGATVNKPNGVAFDPATGRLYWANRDGNKISYANVNGTGGGDIPTLGATVNAPDYPVLLDAPVGEAAPQVSGGAAPGSTLSCSQGTWGADLLPAQLYRAPRSFAYSWSQAGQPISGASAATYTAGAAGSYTCTVTATNAAGSSAQTSAAHSVAVPSFGSKALVKLKLGAAKIPATGPVSVAVTNKNSFAISGKLSGVSKPSPKQKVKLKATSFKAAAGAKVTVKLALPGSLRQVLTSTHKLSISLSAAVVDPAGKSLTVKATVVPKLKAKGK